MRLYADGPSAPPVVSLTFKTCEKMRAHNKWIAYLKAQRRVKMGCILTDKSKSSHTFIVEWSIKIIAAAIETGGQLDEVATPGVARSGETG